MAGHASFRPRGATDSHGSRAPARPEAGAASAAPVTRGPAEQGTESPAGSRSGPARHDELKLCGLAAVRARFARDPGSIQRLYFDQATGRRIGVMCRVIAQGKRIYRQVEPAELEKIAGSVHHGGIVAIVTPPVVRTVGAGDPAEWVRRGESVLVLDRIGNAHNLGAIARTAAFFGVPRIVIPADPTAARATDAAHRVAEGGFEHVEVWQAARLADLARTLAGAGYEVIGAATRGAPSARSVARGRGAAGVRPVALVLGNEEHGLAPEVAAACTRLVTLPGSGQVESLNVSVAAGVLIWELLAPAARSLRAAAP